jgi:CRP-like cAMP-binding protein
MHTVAERVEYADLLEGIPALAGCTRDVLEKFVSEAAMKAHCVAGEVLCGLHEDHNLYVLTSGTAALHVGQDVVISLEVGDYFGQESARHHKIAGTVLALTDVEVLIIGPQDLAQLELASSRDRHPSRTPWTLQRSTATLVRRRRRRHLVMTRHSD